MWALEPTTIAEFQLVSTQVETTISANYGVYGLTNGLNMYDGSQVNRPTKNTGIRQPQKALGPKNGVTTERPVCWWNRC
jgi:hypothetical protein